MGHFPGVGSGDRTAKSPSWPVYQKQVGFSKLSNLSVQSGLELTTIV